jgi:hypothetical protein
MLKPSRGWVVVDTTPPKAGLITTLVKLTPGVVNKGKIVSVGPPVVTNENSIATNVDRDAFLEGDLAFFTQFQAHPTNSDLVFVHMNAIVAVEREKA